MPFGAAILAENLNTPNMKWGVFYFGICLFGQYWTASIQRIILLMIKGDITINFTEDFILTGKSREYQNKALLLFNGFPALLGIVLVAICLFNSWVALAGYVFYIFTLTNPVKSLNRLLPILTKIIK